MVSGKLATELLCLDLVMFLLSHRRPPNPHSSVPSPLSSVHLCGCIGNQLGLILPLRGHLAMSRDIFGCHNWDGATGI